MTDFPCYKLGAGENPHDLNERAYRKRAVAIEPLEVPVRVVRADGTAATIMLHDATDADLAYLASALNDPMLGWRWCRSVARRLAGYRPEVA